MVENPCRRKQVEATPQRHLVLYGEFELTIDDKNRMLIPSEVRKAMLPERDGEAMFLVFGTNRRPWLYPERQYEAMVARIQQELAPTEDALAGMGQAGTCTDPRQDAEAHRLAEGSDADRCPGSPGTVEQG